MTDNVPSLLYCPQCRDSLISKEEESTSAGRVHSESIIDDRKSNHVKENA